MTLAELFQKLSIGPLSDLPIAGEGSGTVPVENYAKLILRVNAALVALYTRFPLQLRTLTLTAVDGIQTYYLRTAFAQTSGSTEVNKYIQDTVADPFKGDVLMVAGVYDGEHAALPLNDRNDCKSWFTTSYDSLAMDYPATGDTYYIEYRARHAEIPLNVVPLVNGAPPPGATDPITIIGAIDVRIPPQLETALLAHIAANMYGSVGSDAALAKSQMHLSQYEGECAFYEERNTFNQSFESTNVKPLQNGWV